MAKAKRPPPDPRETMMKRVRAAKCYTGTIQNQRHAEAVELAAFLDIFHPKMPEARKRELVLAKRNEGQ